MGSMAATSHPWTTPQQPESLLHMELATLSQKKKPQIVNYGECPVKHEGRDPKECVSTRWHKDTEMPPQKKVPVGGAQLRVHRSHLELPQGQFPSASCPGRGGDPAAQVGTSV